MRAIGVVTTLVLAAAMAGAVAVGVRSVPDVKRYLAMRRM
jgi:putative N-acetylmannosamine-6-phosphate epimerase